MNALTLLIAALTGASALAESDLCLLGKDRDVRDWIADGKKYAAISCASDNKLVTRLTKSLATMGYSIITPPAIHEVPLGAKPTRELRAALKSAKCSKTAKQVFTVCVTLKEDQPLIKSRKSKKSKTTSSDKLENISLVPHLEPEPRIEIKPRTGQEMRREGKVRAH